MPKGTQIHIINVLTHEDKAPDVLIETTDQTVAEDKVVLTNDDAADRLLKATQDLNEQKKLRQ
jgi:hypothetical protein